MKIMFHSKFRLHIKTDLFTVLIPLFTILIISSQVEHNILKLELKRLRQTLNQHADGVLNLNKRRLQLQKAMDERKIDIQIHTDMLVQQIKHAQGEKSKIR